MTVPAARRMPQPGAGSRVPATRICRAPYVLALISAGLFTLAFPPFALRPVAWVALAPLLVALRTAARWRTALATMFVWSFAMSAGITHWLVAAVSVYYAQALWIGVAMFVATTFVGATLQQLAFAVALRTQRGLGGAALAAFTASAWTAAELARERTWLANVWGIFGYSQGGVTAASSALAWVHATSPSVLQVADLGGVYAVSFVLVATNAALAEIIVRVCGGDRLMRALGACAFALSIVAGAWIYGRTTIGAPRPPTMQASRVGIAQADLDLGSQWSDQLYGRNLDVYLRLTAEMSGQGPLDVVFWPENAMTFFVDEEPAFRAAISSVLASTGAELVAGAPRYERGNSVRYYNTAFLVGPAGDLRGHYDKQRLLIFAEQFPLPQIAALQARFARVREFTPGGPAALLDTRVGKAGVLICNESMYGKEARERVALGADYLVNLSNDTWISDPQFAETALDMASFRAVENKRWLVRASTSGPSAIVDPFGRVVARSAAFSQAILTGSIERASAQTVYSRRGDVFAWACAVITLIFVARSRLRRGGSRSKP